MRGDVDLQFDRPIERAEWRDFCADHGLQFEPRITGQNTFFAGDVRVSLQEPGVLPKDSRGRVEFADALPPESFTSANVGSLRNRVPHDVAKLAREVCAVFACRIEPSAEIAHLVTDLPRRYVRGVNCTQGPDHRSDEAEGWLRSDRIHAARVQAGRAVLEFDGGTILLRVEGIARASFRDVETARLYAGRCGWRLWKGAVPARVRDATVVSGSKER
jgi:hypothetical protein